MGVVEKFNALNGATVSRDELLDLIVVATSQEQYHIGKKLIDVLLRNSAESFTLEITSPAIETVPKSFLAGLHFESFDDDQPTGLAKPVSPNDVYQIIADRMINMIKEANANGYKRKWAAGSSATGYTIPFNFESKKRYRGVNVFLLTNFDVLENPFFMTFKQIENAKGKLKKGSKGFPVVYFTKLHKIEDQSRNIDFGTYDKGIAISFATNNGFGIDDITTIPILKYYNVFNGKDIENIDFGLKDFKTGYIENEIPTRNNIRIPAAEAILKHYPAPAPSLHVDKSRAFYRPGTDSIHLPLLNDFETVQDYYRTCFHEYSHSTGHHSRLARDFSGSQGSKKYAFEELVAEWGATFLSAEAGIIWHTNKNHAAYLKNWNQALTHIQDDNRFVMRACTKAQELCDFVLQFDDNGDPLYFKDFKETKPEPQITKKRAASKKQQPKQIKKTEILPTNTKQTKRVEQKGQVKQMPKPAVKSRTIKKESTQLALFGAKKGLKSPVIENEQIPAVQPELTVIEKQALQNIPVKYKTAVDWQNENNAPKQLYNLSGDLAKFLGKIEIKPQQSVAITLDSGEGGGKTHTLYNWANQFFEAGYKPIIWSLEEHASSGLATDKAEMYFGKNKAFIPVESENESESKAETIKRIFDSIADFDVIMIDSWAKVMELDSSINFDQDMRKKFNGKLFIVIFQRTSDGSMRGGSKSGFDGDVILKVEVDRADFRNNYIYNHKNRYNDYMPISELKYSPFNRALIIAESEKIDDTESVPSKTPKFSFKV